MAQSTTNAGQRRIAVARNPSSGGTDLHPIAGTTVSLVTRAIAAVGVTYDDDVTEQWRDW